MTAALSQCHLLVLTSQTQTPKVCFYLMFWSLREIKGSYYQFWKLGLKIFTLDNENQCGPSWKFSSQSSGASSFVRGIEKDGNAYPLCKILTAMHWNYCIDVLHGHHLSKHLFSLQCWALQAYASAVHLIHTHLMMRASMRKSSSSCSEHTSGNVWKRKNRLTRRRYLNLQM